MNPQKEIEAIMQRLRLNASNIDEYNEVNDLCIRKLSNLPDRYTKELVSCTKHLLEVLEEDEQNEFFLTILLRVIKKRNQTKDLIEIASNALNNEFTEDKLFYVEQLIEIDDQLVPTVLIKALYNLESYDEYGGHAQEKIIDFLHKIRNINVAPAIIYSLNDISARVRASALQYIRDLNIESASDELMKMLETEDWEYNILIILELIRKWEKEEYLEQLKQFCSEEWVQENNKIKHSFETTISSLK